jgi:hypothetical protein
MHIHEDFRMNNAFDNPVPTERERQLEEKLGGRTILVAILSMVALLELAIIVQLTQ